jgi:hypothetical protein
MIVKSNGTKNPMLLMFNSLTTKSVLAGEKSYFLVGRYASHT